MVPVVIGAAVTAFGVGAQSRERQRKWRDSVPEPVLAVFSGGGMHGLKHSLCHDVDGWQRVPYVPDLLCLLAASMTPCSNGLEKEEMARGPVCQSRRVNRSEMSSLFHCCDPCQCTCPRLTGLRTRVQHHHPARWSPHHSVVRCTPDELDVTCADCLSKQPSKMPSVREHHGRVAAAIQWSRERRGEIDEVGAVEAEVAHSQVQLEARVRDIGTWTFCAVFLCRAHWVAESAEAAGRTSASREAQKQSAPSGQSPHARVHCHAGRHRSGGGASRSQSLPWLRGFKHQIGCERRHAPTEGGPGGRLRHGLPGGLDVRQAWCRAEVGQRQGQR